MALGIESNNTMEIWTIPMKGWGDNEWQDNTWLVDHLRQLADKIEKEKPRLYAAGFEADIQYFGHFYVKVFPNK